MKPKGLGPDNGARPPGAVPFYPNALHDIADP